MLGKLKFYLIRATVFLMPLALIVGLSGFDCNGGGQTPPSQNLEIRTWYDLDQVRHNLAGNHTLMNDLDSSSAGYEELAGPTANEGKGWQPIGYQTREGGTCNPYVLEHGLAGTFEGQGYEIRDLFINRPEAGSSVGLFAYVVEGGIIRNVGLVNVDVTGWHTVGSLVGTNQRGTINRCYSTGNVTGSYATIGGLIGWNGGGVSGSHSSGSVTGDGHVGGLMGVNDANVSNTYSAASVSGAWRAGGLVGLNEGTVSNSYSTGRVTGDEQLGGLVGYDDWGTVTNCFWNAETSGQTDSAGGIGRSTAEMKSIAIFSGAAWNITAVADPGARNASSVWNIVDGQTYPFLSWQPGL
jgi:hypothetical protein